MKSALLFLFCFWWQTVGCDVVLNALFLIDSVKFNPSVFEKLLSSLFGSATLLSIQSETPTGAEVRNLYFPSHTEIRLFQLVHVTRVQAAIASSNETNTTNYMSRYLPAYCEDAIAPMVIISADGTTGFDLLAQIPPLVAPVAIGVWITTMVTCGICWICVCCCRNKKPPQPIVTVKPLDPVEEELIEPEPLPPEPETVDPTPTAPPLPQPAMSMMYPQNFPLMRLPPGFEFVSQYDQYERQTLPGGPAAVRLESWPEEQDQ
jgi:hypothetical protein